METYTKLFSSIVHSSIWREPPHVRLVWVTMLALSDRYGYVGASVPGLADASRVTLEECEDALRRFQEPDRHSRSQEHEGRRIKAVPRGWQLLNHEKFREARNDDERREQNRQAQARRRQKVADSQQSQPASAEVSQSKPIRSDQIRSIPSGESASAADAPRASVDFMDCEDDLPCPLNLYDKAKERGVLSELGKAFGREAEWVESVAYEFCSHWTVGKGSGVRRKAWMGKLRKWVTDKHSKNEGPTPGSAHPKETNSERRPERALFKEREVKRAENGAELAREAIANLTRR